MRTKHLKGFTLIELMVVILILAILAALIVPRVIGHSAQAKRAKASADISELRNAINRFRIDCDRLPTSDEGLSVLLQGGDIRGWHGPYLDRPTIPPDPWQGEYVYEDQGNDQFTVVSYGSDGAPGGEAGTEAEDVGDVAQGN
jgi:general secretion pathway protein G